MRSKLKSLGDKLGEIEQRMPSCFEATQGWADCEDTDLPGCVDEIGGHSMPKRFYEINVGIGKGMWRSLGRGVCIAGDAVHVLE